VQGIHFLTFGFIPSRGLAKDVPFLGELLFSVSCRFRVVDPRISSKSHRRKIANRPTVTLWAKHVQTTVCKSGLSLEIGH